jgi:hypothetical protein
MVTHRCRVREPGDVPDLRDAVPAGVGPWLLGPVAVPPLGLVEPSSGAAVGQDPQARVREVGLGTAAIARASAGRAARTQLAGKPVASTAQFHGRSG